MPLSAPARRCRRGRREANQPLSCHCEARRAVAIQPVVQGNTSGLLRAADGTTDKTTQFWL